jgi:hypothetical protein
MGMPEDSYLGDKEKNEVLSKGLRGRVLKRTKTVAQIQVDQESATKSASDDGSYEGDLTDIEEKPAKKQKTLVRETIREIQQAPTSRAQIRTTDGRGKDTSKPRADAKVCGKGLVIRIKLIDQQRIQVARVRVWFPCWVFMNSPSSGSISVTKRRPQVWSKIGSQTSQLRLQLELLPTGAMLKPQQQPRLQPLVQRP